MEFYDIFGLICFIVIFYFFGLSKGIKLILIIFFVSVIIVSIPYFFGNIGKYILFFIIVILAIILNNKSLKRKFIDQIRKFKL